MRYVGAPQFLLRSTVRYVFFVMVRVRYASKIELKYDTVEDARYVVRKFRTYRTAILAVQFYHQHMRSQSCEKNSVANGGKPEKIYHQC